MMKRVYPTILTVTNDAVLVEVPDLEILTEGTDIINAIDLFFVVTRKYTSAYIFRKAAKVINAAAKMIIL